MTCSCKRYLPHAVRIVQGAYKTVVGRTKRVWMRRFGLKSMIQSRVEGKSLLPNVPDSSSLNMKASSFLLGDHGSISVAGQMQ